MLLLAADDATAVDDVETALLGTGSFVAADIGKRPATSTPLLSELSSFDAVLLWNEDPWDDQAGLGDVLNTYLLAGGAVVLGAHTLELGSEPLGAFDGASASPLVPDGSASVPGDIDLTLADLSHPLYAGITTVTFPDERQGSPALTAGAELLGVDSAGNNVVAAWCDRSVVALNIFPPSIPVSSADVALLFANAITMTSLDAPPAAAAAGPYTVDEGGSVPLDATGTTDGDLGPVTLSWDIDADGTFGDLTGATPTFDASALDGPSSITVTVRATDTCGRTDDASSGLTVENVLPVVATVSNGGPVVEGTAVSLTATGSDVAADPLTWSWTLGDATTDVGASITHLYPDDGTYTAEATADDGDGGTASGTTTVVVTNAPPSITSVSNDGPRNEAATVTFAVVATDPGGAADPLSYAWDFGDGTTDTGVAPTHAYADDGTFVASVTVTDDEGASVTGSTTVTVDNVSPTVTSVTDDGPRDEQSTVTFGAAATDPAGALDPLSWTWDFGDGTTGSGPAPTKVYADDGVYTATATVTDGDGGSASGTTTVTIDNVAPAVGSIVHDAPQAETVTISFSVSASDVAGAADPLTYAWDFGDGVPGSGSSTTHAYGDDGSYTATVTVSDDDGGSTSTSATVVVTNTAPTLTALVGDTAGLVGQTLSFAASATDPAGAADPPTFAWDFGDSTTGSGASVSHPWLTPGTFTVSLVVDDGDGGTASGSLGVTITNPGPTISLAPAPSGILEAGFETLTATASDVLGAPVTLSWDWGDGSAASVGLGLTSAGHAWPDDGPWTVTVTATDVFGASATATVEVPVANVAPSITANPVGTGEEAVQYTAALTRSDPAGSLDPPTWTLLSGPVGASLVGSTVTWTPDYAQAEAGALAFEVQVDDGDGGTDTVSWTVDPDWTDADADGLPDTWELANGLDPTSDDASADPDGDGLDNAAEYADGTDPQGTNAPGAPVLTAPLQGASVFTVSPILIWDDAIDPDGDAVTHEVEVYADEQLSTLLDSVSGLSTSTGQSTWTVSAALPEDALAWWRARASDANGDGPWTQAESFFVDSSNSAPTMPAPLSPFDETVTVLLPDFVTGPVADPEGDDIDVVVRIRDATGALFDTLSAEQQGDGGWLAESAVPLAEDVDWSWTAEAVDGRGATLGESASTPFVVDVTNTAPDVPVFVSPDEGEVVDNALAVSLSIGADPDGDEDPLFVRLQADVEEDFIGVDRQEVGPSTGIAAEVVVLSLPALLPENRFVWLRARTEDDRGGASAWVARRVYVDGLPEPPTAVTIVAPSAEQVVAPDALSVRWAPAADPEDGALTYTVELFAEGAEEAAWSASDLTISGGEGQVDVPLELDARAWLVRARATDVSGLDGPWGPSVRFVVLPRAGEGFDLGPGDGTGCACSARVGGGGSAPLLGLLLGLGALGLRNGRRRRPRGAP